MMKQDTTKWGNDQTSLIISKKADSTISQVSLFALQLIIVEIMILGMLSLEIHAAQFDLARAGNTVFDPVLKLVTDHYGKAVVAVGGAGAIIAPGDLRTKAIGFGIGAAIAGLTMLAVKTGFGI